MTELVLVDSNILLDIFTDDPKWCNWSINILEEYSKIATLCINPIVYSEVSIGFEQIETLELAIKEAKFKYLELPKEALFLAGKIFKRYRKGAGQKNSPLPDFYIAAHAAVLEIPLITRDKKSKKFYLPKLKLITP